jgi:hypothetical protein
MKSEKECHDAISQIKKASVLFGSFLSSRSKFHLHLNMMWINQQIWQWGMNLVSHKSLLIRSLCPPTMLWPRMSCMSALELLLDAELPAPTLSILSHTLMVTPLSCPTEFFYFSDRANNHSSRVNGFSFHIITHVLWRTRSPRSL